MLNNESSHEGAVLDKVGGDSSITIEDTPTPVLDGQTEKPVLETEPKAGDEVESDTVEQPSSTSDFGIKTEEQYIADASVLEKRIADKEAYITVLKTRVDGGEQIVKTLTQKLDSVLGFFSTTPDEADSEKFIEIQKSIPNIRMEITQNLALVKLRSAAGQLDLNSEEAEKVNRSLKEDGYDAETISRSSDKSILYYIKSVVEEYRQTRSVTSSLSTPNSDVKDLKDLVSQQAKELKELKGLLITNKKQEPEVKPKAKPSKPPVATPSGTGGKVTSKDNSFAITGDVRI